MYFDHIHYPTSSIQLPLGRPQSVPLLASCLLSSLTFFVHVCVHVDLYVYVCGGQSWYVIILLFWFSLLRVPRWTWSKPQWQCLINSSELGWGYFVPSFCHVGPAELNSGSYTRMANTSLNHLHLLSACILFQIYNPIWVNFCIWCNQPSSDGSSITCWKGSIGENQPATALGYMIYFCFHLSLAPRLASFWLWFVLLNSLVTFNF